MTESPLICYYCTSTHQQDNKLIMTSHTQLLSSWSVGWFLLIQIGGGLWLSLNETINTVCYFFINDVKDWYTAPGSTAKTHEKNKNMISVYWGEFLAHTSLFALMLWWLWSPHSHQWFHQTWRDHISNYLSSTTGGKLCQQVQWLMLPQILPQILLHYFDLNQTLTHHLYTHTHKKKTKVSLWGFLQRSKLLVNTFLEIKDPGNVGGRCETNIFFPEMLVSHL